MADNAKGKRRTGAPTGQIAKDTAAPVAAESLASVAVTPAQAEAMVATLDTAPPVGILSGLLGEDGVDKAKQQVNNIAPTFGSVLLAIGKGVAESQQALDRSLIETVATLRDTKITVVTDVIQELGDDGLPDLENAPTLVTEEVSLLNYVPPTNHYFTGVSLSMDMTVSGMSAESGMTFSRQQTQAAGSAGSSYWGFYNWFDGYSTHSQVTQQSNTQTETQWATGQVRLDATMGTRRADKLPVGVEIEIGPQISFSQGPVKEVRDRARNTTRREVVVTITVRKASGALNGGCVLDVSCDPFSVSIDSNVADSYGTIRATVYREYSTASPVQQGTGKLTVKLGALTRTVDVIL